VRTTGSAPSPGSPGSAGTARTARTPTSHGTAASAGTPARWSALPLAAAAVVVAGAAVAVVPQHTLSIVRVLVATVAVVALVAALVTRLRGIDQAGPDARPTRSPFESTTERRRTRRDQPASLARVRGEIGDGVVRADLAPLSTLAARRLATVVTTALEREGLDVRDPAHQAAVRARLSPQALAAITADRAFRRPSGAAPHPRRSASAQEIAATIHAVLDEVERPQTPPGAP
jgi:hypothetical protein